MKVLPQTYKFEKKETNKVLVLRHANKEKDIKMTYVSNSEF